MATIKDVAKLAGVSTATVSRALMKPEMVSEKVRGQVAKAVESTGYTANSMARNLRTMKTRLVVVVVPDITNPFFSEVIRGMSHVAAAKGYSVLLGDTQHDPVKEQAFAELVMARQADGMILLNGRLPRPKSNGQNGSPSLPPLVMACEYQTELQVPTVRLDNVGAAKTVVQHLLEGGHRRIGFITGPMWNVLTRDRLQGYRDGLIEGGRSYQPEWVVEGDFSINSGFQATKRILEWEPRPTAIFASNDEMAIGAIKAIKERSLRVPQDISVVGFDDIQFAGAYDPSLTTIAQPREEIGGKAMEILCDLLAGKPIAQTQVILPGVLVVRESSGPVGG